MAFTSFYPDGVLWPWP